MKTVWHKDAPPAPFMAVIFVSKKSNIQEGYQETDDYIMKLAQEQEGYLGYSVSAEPEGGIFISYWKDEDCIHKWRNNLKHIEAKTRAKTWYDYYHSLVCEVKTHKEFKALVEQKA